MSKSRGNVVNPDQFIDQYGADCFRTYLMFLGPYTQGGDFQDLGIMGVRRFYDRIYRLVLSGSIANRGVSAPDNPSAPERQRGEQDLLTLMHRTIRDVTGHIRNLDYNTAIAFLMEYLNGITKQNAVHKVMVEVLVKLMAPFAPHLAEELWEMLGHSGSVFTSGWPSWDESMIVVSTFELVAQVNGKIRATISAPVDITKDEAINMAVSHPNVQRFTDGKTIRKTIYVPNKLVNIVVS